MNMTFQQPSYYAASAGTNTRRAVVLHATAGSWPSDRDWLSQGGQPGNRVSCHYIISPAGEIVQHYADTAICWHAGRSTWMIDGQRIPDPIGLNPYSIGIELSHPNRADVPYPAAQYDAALWLTRRLVAQYDIPRNQLVRHLDIAPRRKTDPAGFAWDPFVHEVYGALAPAPDDDIQVIGVQQVLQRQAFIALCRDRQFGLSPDEAERLFEMCADWHIDARFVAAIGLVEHENYPARSPLFQQSRNPGSIKARDPEMRFVTWNNRRFIQFEAAYQGWTYLVWWLKYRHAWIGQAFTVRAINRIYAPGGVDGNVDPEQRSDRMITDMRAMLERNQ